MGGRTDSESANSTDALERKRTAKACDRCRLKKTKCRGSQPCDRCTVDNSICTFDRPRKVCERTYPKGYVELLEKQQDVLVGGLQKLYAIACDGGLQTRPVANTRCGRPLTTDILSWLGELDTDQGSPFFENPEDLKRLTFDQGKSTSTTTAEDLDWTCDPAMNLEMDSDYELFWRSGLD